MPIKVDVNIDMNRINSRINKACKPMANQFMLEADKYVPRKLSTVVSLFSGIRHTLIINTWEFQN